IKGFEFIIYTSNFCHLPSFGCFCVLSFRTFPLFGHCIALRSPGESWGCYPRCFHEFHAAVCHCFVSAKLGDTTCNAIVVSQEHALLVRQMVAVSVLIGDASATIAANYEVGHTTH